jgi:hypothetical protein
MDQRVLAYLLIALLAITLAAFAARTVYYSRAKVLRRRKHADAARWAARARDVEQAATPDPGP